MSVLPEGIRPILDPSLPKMNVRITLNTGANAMLEVNGTTKVADLHTWVMSVSSVPYNGYQLVAGYPPVALIDPNATIESARLRNTNIIMKIV